MKNKNRKRVSSLDTPLGFLEHFKENDEMYHYLFPIAMGGRYKFSMTSLRTFQLNTWGPEVIPSRSSEYQGSGSLEETFHSRLEMNEAARIFCRSYYPPTEIPETEVTERASEMARGLFQSIEKSQFYPYQFKKMKLERMTEEEIGHKFASTMARGDIDGYVEEALMHADITSYLAAGNSKWFQKGAHFFWTEQLVNVFSDFGIVKIDPTFRYLVFLQFINNY